MTTQTITVDTGTDQLLCEIRERVAVITLNRPEARNALSDQLTPALRRMIRERGDDERVGALLITGAGTAFCAGGDVKGMGNNSTKKSMTAEERFTDLLERERLLTGALIGLRKPTVAALPGAAAGAGLAIALACDIRVAAQSAFVSAGYSKIGLSGDYGIAWLLTRTVGSPIAREMMFTSDRIDSERALRIGLFNRVVVDSDLQATAFALARSVANGPAVALKIIKDNLDDAAHIDFDTALSREARGIVASSASADHAEAVNAFIEKRPPRFKGA